MESENVKSMTAEEVGQYVLLLCAAWLGAKDATLPNNPVYLARTARCEYGETVSPIVMERFHIVTTEWGDRLQNDTLFGEWTRAVQRSQKKRNAVAVRWDNSRNTTVQQLVIPKPNQAVPIQSVPDQTEPEAETVSMKKRILEIAGKRSMNQFDADDVRRLHRLYGENLIEDFRSWMDEQPQGSDLYISSYLKIAESRLKGEQERGIIQSDSRINEIVAFAYTISQQAPRGVDVAKLLIDHSQEEIQDAFKAYAEPLDDWNLANSVRTFFKDGAGTGIILARRQKKAADAALTASVATSIETGVEARRAEADARKKRMDEEERLAEKLGDNPF